MTLNNKRKKPQISIPVNLINLDISNPRLGQNKKKNTSQEDLLIEIYEKFDIEDLAYSMASNGYFEEEPIIVVPENLPKNFSSNRKIDLIEKDLINLIEKEKIKFIVIEGNRRASTAKLLTDATLRRVVTVDEDFPTVSGDVLSDLTSIPAIVYFDKEEVISYLGVRHISSNLKWEAYAKARFIALRIEELKSNGLDISSAIKKVKDQIGISLTNIKKQYFTFKLIEQAEDDIINFNSNPIKEKFSLLGIAIGNGPIRDYIGIEHYNKTDFTSKLVPNFNLEKFEQVLNWIFGSDKNKAVITDSRKMSKFGYILSKDDSTSYLIKTGDFEAAYERSDGNENFVLKKINIIQNSIRDVNQFSLDFSEHEVIKDELKQTKELFNKLIIQFRL